VLLGRLVAHPVDEKLQEKGASGNTAAGRTEETVVAKESKSAEVANIVAAENEVAVDDALGSNVQNLSLRVGEDWLSEAHNPFCLPKRREEASGTRHISTGCSDERMVTKKASPMKNLEGVHLTDSTASTGIGSWSWRSENSASMSSAQIALHASVAAKGNNERARASFVEADLESKRGKVHAARKKLGKFVMAMAGLTSLRKSSQNAGLATE
jgi:hypothetical protein